MYAIKIHERATQCAPTKREALNILHSLLSARVEASIIQLPAPCCVVIPRSLGFATKCYAVEGSYVYHTYGYPQSFKPGGLWRVELVSATRLQQSADLAIEESRL